jgi:hypothetical protein
MNLSELYTLFKLRNMLYKCVVSQMTLLQLMTVNKGVRNALLK